MPNFISTSETIQLNTDGYDQIIDVTDQVRRFVGQSGVVSGQVTIFIPGETASITTIEYEPGLVEDIPKLLEEWMPYKRDWAHNQTWGDGNGGSHLRAAFIGPSLVVPVVQGEMTLGTWQQIVVIDHDVRPRQRKVVFQIIGQE